MFGSINCFLSSGNIDIPALMKMKWRLFELSDGSLAVLMFASKGMTIEFQVATIDGKG